MWCIEHNAQVTFTHDLTVTVKIQLFEHFFEGNSFCNAIEIAHKALEEYESQHGGITSKLVTRDTSIEGE